MEEMSSRVQGHCDKRFDGVRAVMEKHLESGEDVGASFAMSLNGEMLVDIWGGHTDTDRSTPWQENTLVNVYSTTKTMSFLCALLLADRGLLDFDRPVAEYWPEFAANGKEQVLVWHIMNHAAGLSGMDELVTVPDVYDWEKITSLLAAQAPWWEPGTATAYHALTQGYLIGELVRRISGKSIGRFFQEELASPLGADFFIGVPASEAGRIARLIPPAKNFAIKTGENKESIAARTFRSPAITAQDSWTPEWQQAEIPAANGHGNARSVVKVHSLLACKGQINGLRLLSRESAESVMHERIAGTDMALGAPMRFGLGFGINSPAMPLSPNANACFWGGWGGSAVIIDQDAGIAMSYVMNKMYPGLMGDTRSADFVGAVYQALAG